MSNRRKTEEARLQQMIRNNPRRRHRAQKELNHIEQMKKISQVLESEMLKKEGPNAR